MTKVPDESKIDDFLESLMKWATTGRICEDVYFWLRYQFLRVVTVLYPCVLPLTREAERELKRHEKHLRPQCSLVERLGEGWKWPTLIFVLPLLLTVAIAGTIESFLIYTDTPSQHALSVAQAREQSQQRDPTVALTGDLKTTATVLATLTGLLLAVVALTINVKTSSFAGAGFLLNAIIRRRAFLPTAAFLLGTVFTALAGVLLADHVGLRFLNDWTLTVALLGLACLFVLFCLLRNTMQTLGTPELEQLLSNELLLRLRDSFQDKLRQSLVESLFCKKLEAMGFARSSATQKDADHQTEYRLARLGRIIGIDLAPLMRISTLLRLAPLSPASNTPTMFGYRQHGDAPSLTVQASGRVTKDTHLALLTKEQTPSKRIDRLVQYAFIVRTPSESDLTWESLRQVICTAVDRHEAATIRAVARALDDILDDYLETQHAVGGRGNMVMEDSFGRIVYGFAPPDVFELRLSPLIMDADRGRSEDCLEELLNCVYRLAMRAFDRQNEKYFRQWVFEFHTACHSAGPQTDDPGSKVKAGVVYRMGWLGDSFGTHLFVHGESSEEVRRTSPYAVVFLSLCLHMLRTSAERADERTFDGVAEHLNQFLQRELRVRDSKGCLDAYRAADRRNVDRPVPPGHLPDRNLLIAYDEIYDYKNLVYVIVGAWLTHKVKKNGLQVEQVTPFMEKIVARTCGFRDLLDLYAMLGMADFNTEASDLLTLGFSQWDCPQPHGQDETAFATWVKPFYQFLLLKKAAMDSVGQIALGDIRQTSGANHGDLKRFLTEMASSDYSLPPTYQGLSWGLNTEELGSAKQHISELLDRWSSESAKPSSGEEVSAQGSE